MSAQKCRMLLVHKIESFYKYCRLSSKQPKKPNIRKFKVLEKEAPLSCQRGQSGDRDDYWCIVQTSCTNSKNK